MFIILLHNFKDLLYLNYLFVLIHLISTSSFSCYYLTIIIINILTGQLLFLNRLAINLIQLLKLFL